MLLSSNGSFFQVGLSEPSPPPQLTRSGLTRGVHHLAVPSIARVNIKLSWMLQFTSYLMLLYVAYNSIITSFVTFAPKSQPAPRGLIAHVSTSSGSDQTRSQKAPLWGISWLRSMVRIWSSVLMSGERPPCTQRICSSINWSKKETHAK